VDVAAVFFREFLFYFSSLAIGRPRAAAAHGGRKGKEGSRAGQLGPGGHVRPNHATVWSSSNEADGVDRQGAGPPVRDPLPSRGKPMCRPRGRETRRNAARPVPPLLLLVRAVARGSLGITKISLHLLRQQPTASRAELMIVRSRISPIIYCPHRSIGWASRPLLLLACGPGDPSTVAAVLLASI
jgi:hypothetical protein